MVAASLSAGLVLADQTVTIEATSFSPATITIAAGDKVVWSNVQPTDAHTATADKGSFDTGLIAPGQTMSVTFLTPGTFGYTCQVLPSMKGTVIVTAAEPNASPTPTPHRPPPTDARNDLLGGPNGPSSGLLLGLVLLAGALVIAAANGTRRRTARARASRWSVLAPGEAPRRGGSVGDRYPRTDQWIADDRPRG